MIVFDASTLVGAAIGRRSRPRLAFDKARAEDTFALSSSVWAEIVQVLHRPRLTRFVDAALRDELLDVLGAAASWFTPIQRVSVCRDPKDDKYLELALASDAATIVTSDADLLTLNPWQVVRIVLPADYLAARQPDL